MIGCVVKYCPNYAFIRFPHPTSSVFHKWLEVLDDEELKNLDPETIYSNKRICLWHFDRESRRKLDTAVPTLHLKHYVPDYVVRKKQNRTKRGELSDEPLTASKKKTSEDLPPKTKIRKSTRKRTPISNYFDFDVETDDEGMEEKRDSHAKQPESNRKRYVNNNGQYPDETISKYECKTLRHCVVNHCPNYAFIRFPHPARTVFYEWLIVLDDKELENLDPVTIYKNKRICLWHFDQEARRKLDTAVPTLNLKHYVPDHAVCKRESKKKNTTSITNEKLVQKTDDTKSLLSKMSEIKQRKKGNVCQNTVTSDAAENDEEFLQFEADKSIIDVPHTGENIEEKILNNMEDPQLEEKCVKSTKTGTNNYENNKTYPGGLKITKYRNMVAKCLKSTKTSRNKYENIKTYPGRLKIAKYKTQLQQVNKKEESVKYKNTAYSSTMEKNVNDVIEGMRIALKEVTIKLNKPSYLIGNREYLTNTKSKTCQLKKVAAADIDQSILNNTANVLSDVTEQVGTSNICQHTITSDTSENTTKPTDEEFLQFWADQSKIGVFHTGENIEEKRLNNTTNVTNETLDQKRDDTRSSLPKMSEIKHPKKANVRQNTVTSYAAENGIKPTDEEFLQFGADKSKMNVSHTDENILNILSTNQQQDVKTNYIIDLTDELENCVDQLVTIQSPKTKTKFQILSTNKQQVVKTNYIIDLMEESENSVEESLTCPAIRKVDAPISMHSAMKERAKKRELVDQDPMITAQEICNQKSHNDKTSRLLKNERTAIWVQQTVPQTDIGNPSKRGKFFGKSLDSIPVNVDNSKTQLHWTNLATVEQKIKEENVKIKKKSVSAKVIDNSIHECTDIDKSFFLGILEPTIKLKEPSHLTGNRKYLTNTKRSVDSAKAELTNKTSKLEKVIVVGTCKSILDNTANVLSVAKEQVGTPNIDKSKPNKKLGQNRNDTRSSLPKMFQIRRHKKANIRQQLVTSNASENGTNPTDEKLLQYGVDKSKIDVFHTAENIPENRLHNTISITNEKLDQKTDDTKSLLPKMSEIKQSKEANVCQNTVTSYAAENGTKPTDEEFLQFRADTSKIDVFHISENIEEKRLNNTTNVTNETLDQKRDDTRSSLPKMSEIKQPKKANVCQNTVTSNAAENGTKLTDEEFLQIRANKSKIGVFHTGENIEEKRLNNTTNVTNETLDQKRDDTRSSLPKMSEIKQPKKANLCQSNVAENATKPTEENFLQFEADQLKIDGFHTNETIEEKKLHNTASITDDLIIESRLSRNNNQESFDDINYAFRGFSLEQHSNFAILNSVQLQEPLMPSIKRKSPIDLTSEESAKKKKLVDENLIIEDLEIPKQKPHEAQKAHHESLRLVKDGKTTIPKEQIVPQRDIESPTNRCEIFGNCFAGDLVKSLTSDVHWTDFVMVDSKKDALKSKSINEIDYSKYQGTEIDKSFFSEISRGIVTENKETTKTNDQKSDINLQQIAALLKTQNEELKQVHKTKSCTCKSCSKSFKAPKYLYKHVRRQHLKTRIKCFKCKQQCLSYMAIVKHISRKHDDSRSKGLWCGRCGATLRSFTSMVEHKRARHSCVVKKCKCDGCPRRFRTPTLLTIHSLGW